MSQGIRTLAAGALAPVFAIPFGTAIGPFTRPNVALSNSEATSQTFYVTMEGDDAAGGRTPETSWATIRKVNESLPDNSRVRFRRGDTFYGELNLPFGADVGAFGVGARPILTMFKILNKPDGWLEHSEGIWMIDLSSPTTHGGYDTSNDANVGFLVVDGTVMPVLKFDLADLANQWDFYCDIPSHTLFVKSSTNPTELAADIKAAPNGNAYGPSGTVIYCQRGQNEIEDIHVTGSGGCGIRGSGSDVHVHDCLIDYIGGAWLPSRSNPTLRWGNGIEHWPSVGRWTIENNEIAQVYDVAWSSQGSDPNGGPISWTDMNIRNNHFHDCGQMIELWSENSNPDSPGFVRIKFEKNLCERAGGGVFADVRPDQAVRVHLLTYKLQTPVDVSITDNFFVGSSGAYSYHSSKPPAGYLTRNNTILLKAGTKMEYQRDETVEDADAWRAATGMEFGSAIGLLP